MQFQTISYLPKKGIKALLNSCVESLQMFTDKEEELQILYRHFSSSSKIKYIVFLCKINSNSLTIIFGNMVRCSIYYNLEKSHHPHMKEAINQNATTTNNNLQLRTREIIDLLYKNNEQFAKGMPSQNHFKQILEHSYNCFDQLDFIILEYSKNSINYLEPKLIAENMQRTMRGTKYLFANIRHWVESYCLDIFKKVWEEKRHLPGEVVQQVKCLSCNNYTEEMILKEAKKEIFGYSSVREMFQLDLKEEETNKNKPLSKLEEIEYVGSVSYLAKIIKQMEDSVHGYEQLTETIEKDQGHDDVALKCLDDLIASMKRRLGQKCIYRLKKVVRSWEATEKQKVGHSRKILDIHNEVRECFVPEEGKKISATFAMVKKLKQQNCRLQSQIINMTASYNIAQDSLLFLEKKQQIQTREMGKLSSMLEQGAVEKRSLILEINNTKRASINYQSSSLSLNGKQKENIFDTQGIVQKKSKNFSKFKARRMVRQSEANRNDVTILEKGDQANASNNSSVKIALNNKNSIHTQVNQDFLEDQIKQKYLDVGCQWQDTFAVQSDKIKQKNQRISKISKRNSKDKVILHRISKKLEIYDQKNQTLPVYTSNDKKRTSRAINFNLKNENQGQNQNEALNKTHRLSLQSHAFNQLLQNNPKRSAKDMLQKQNAAFGVDNKTSVKFFEREAQPKRISMDRMNLYNNKLKQLNLTNEKSKVVFEKNESNFSKQIKKILNSHRFATEGSEVLKKKKKRVRNTIFKPQHLEIFGGVSQSYTYQNSSSEESCKLSQQENMYVEALLEYLNNLTNFKNSFYDNIIMFLKKPYTLIDKNEIQFNQTTQSQIKKSVLKLIAVHKKKCEGIECSHIKLFNCLIGLN